MKLFKLSIINLISAITVKLSDIILLPSEKALKMYDENRLYRNKNRYYIPLMYDDEIKLDIEVQQKIYFSYIGTIASDHSFEEYLSFVESCIKKGDLPDMKFLIATKSMLSVDARLKILVDSGRLHIIEGHPLTDEEINVYYNESLIIWNAYTRTTQSGVLAKAFMFGTPAIVLHRNISEFVTPDNNVEVIENNGSYEEIMVAVKKIRDNKVHYIRSARDAFLDFFYYKKYNEKIKKIIG